MRAYKMEDTPVSSCRVTIGLCDRPFMELRDEGREVERTVNDGDDRCDGEDIELRHKQMNGRTER